MKQLWMVVNAFWHSNSTRGMEAVFGKAAKDSGLALTVKYNDLFITKDSQLPLPDAVLFFDKDIRLAQRLETLGLRLYNSAQAIAVCDDKTWTTLFFDQSKLPQPKTIICPATFPSVGFGNLQFLEQVADELGFPMVVKEGMGSFGQQVYLAQDLASLRHLVQKLLAVPLLFQQFIAESAGMDLRVYVVGKQAVAAIRRENQEGDFRANLAHGGQAFPHVPTREEAELAVAACQATGADFAGVDLLLGKQGPLVCEVNSNAHFLGLTSATGINPAHDIIQLIKEQL